jgi:DNA mismatch repair protein MutS2
MSLFNHFLSDVGDSQSIEHELSTYSSRLEYMKTFLKVANKRSLVFIDEFGTGTDPELGGALAEVILEELARKQAMGIITTHYTNLKLLADKLDGVINASMLFNPETLLPLYQLVVGQPGSSYTFEVAEKIGLPQSVIKRARERVSKEKRVFNQLLSDLQAEKTRLIEETRKAREAQEAAEVAQRMFEETDAKLKLRMERERERQEAQARINDLGRKFQVLTEEWQQTKNKKDVIQKFVSNVTAEKKRLKQEMEEERRNNTREKVIERVLKTIQPGSRVRVLGSRETGVVEEVVRQKARVRWGAFMSVVGLENLEVINDA